jgi:hypothetical protein
MCTLRRLVCQIEPGVSHVWSVSLTEDCRADDCEFKATGDEGKATVVDLWQQCPDHEEITDGA